MIYYKYFNKKTLNATENLIKYAAKNTVKGVKLTGKMVWNHRENIAGGIIGSIKGAYTFGQDIYGITFDNKSCEKQITKINEQSCEYKSLYNKLKRKYSNKEILIDSLGITVTFCNNYFFINNIPEEIELAFKTAYPQLSKNYSLEDVIYKMDDTQIQGLVNSIKGKLFELRYVDYLNNGNLPDGYNAIMASSANNPGWDIAILNSDGTIAKELQMKATDSLNYVKEALDKYPDISVVTTDEMYSNLIMHGMADNVINSGISNAELTEVVTEALENNSLEMNFGLPVIPLLIIGYSVYKKENISSLKKGVEFGERYTKAYISYLTGGAVAVLTNIWWLGLATSIGTNILTGYGRANLNKVKVLNDLIENNENILSKLRLKVNNI